MSESRSPDDGLAPELERDLEVLLSGRAGAGTGGWLPAAALTALRAAPRPGELDGEAAARAAFRLFVRPAVDWPAEGSLAALDPPSGPPVLNLPPPPAPRPHSGRRPQPAVRPAAGPRHRRRRGFWPGQRPAPLLGAGAAGLVVLLCVLLLSGHQGGPGRQAASGTGPASVRSTAVKVPQLQGSGTSEPSLSPSASRSRQSQSASSVASQPSPATLCQQFFALRENYGQSDRAAERAIIAQLSQDLGSRPEAFAYCYTVFESGQSNPWASDPGAGNGWAGNPGPPQSGGGRGPNDAGSSGGSGGAGPGGRF